MITTLMNNWLAVPKIDEMKEEDGYVKPMKKEIVLLSTTSQYAEKSTAHGISYIFEDGRLPAERFLWTIIVIAGLSFRYKIQIQNPNQKKMMCIIIFQLYPIYLLNTFS